MAPLALILLALLQPQEHPPVTSPIILSDGITSYAVGAHLDYLEDPRGEWRLSDVVSPPQSGAFRASERPAPSFGYTRSAYWLRFSVRDASVGNPAWLLLIGNKSLDRVEVFTVPAIEGFGVKVLGDGFPFHVREIRHRNLVVPLPEAAPEGGYTVYLRVTSDGPLRIPLHILSTDGFSRRDRGEHLFLGAFFGVLVLMTVYNLSLFVALRERTYLFYVLYVGSFILYQLSVERFGFEYMWPENLWWAERANSFLALICALWGIQFSRSYLRAREYSRRVDRLLAALAAASVPLMVFVHLGPREFVNLVIAAYFIVTPMVLVAAGVVCFLNGHRAAIYYLAAWFALLAGTWVGMLGNLGVFSHPLLGTRSVQLGSIAELTLLSLGLGFRYDWLRRDRDRIRMRIATDLHDDIGSGLTQLSLYSALIRPYCTGKAAEWAEECGALARELTGKMQDIVWAVRPVDEGWAALETRMKDYGNRTLTPRGIEFDMRGDVSHEHTQLDADVRSNVLLMYKEIIHNAARHSECGRFVVRFRVTRDVLRLNLCDDGRGFDPSSTDRKSGLRNVESRAHDLRALLRVETRPGGPTCYTLDVPLNRSAARKNGWRPTDRRRNTLPQDALVAT